MAELVLRNLDLLREIFQHLESCPKLQLLAVALTCRSFAEPAQDCLWRTMHSIVPFLNLIPSVRCSTDGFQYIMDNQPLSSYPRFMAHAVRVQRFHFPDFETWSPGSPRPTSKQLLPTLSMVRLAQVKGEGPLFPALRHIVYQSSRTVLEDLLLLSESQVESLVVLNHRKQDRQVPMFLSSVLPSLAASLRDLTLQGDAWLTPDIMGVMPLLSSLRTLKLDVPPQNKPFHALNGLRQIEELTISAGQTFILHFLHHIPSRKLKTVTLARKDRQNMWVDRDPTRPPASHQDFWHICAGQLREKASSTLISLSIDDLIKPDPFTTFAIQSFLDMIYPLRKLENLHIGVLSTHPVTMNDTDYANIAQAWPQLRSLNLLLPYTSPQYQFLGLANIPAYCPSPEPQSPKPHPTVVGLYTLASRCADLISLQIYLPSVHYPTSALPSTFNGQSALTSLWLGNCAAGDDPFTTASLLQKLFPNLQKVAGVVPFPGAPSNALAGAGEVTGFEWMAVQRWVTCIGEIRMAERARIAAILNEEGVNVSGKAQRRIHCD